MIETQLVLGGAAEVDFERQRPPYLLDQIYPDLLEKHPDVIEIIEPLLANYARSIRELDYSFDAVRSGFHRLIVHNPLIGRVGSEFAYVQEHYSLEDLIWRELGRGPNDFDGFVGKIKTGDHEPKKFAEDELLMLARHFLENAETVLPEILKLRSYDFTVDPRRFDENTHQEVIEYLAWGGDYNREYGIKVMFGQHKLKPEITIGKIEVVDISTNREVFVFDLGFYTNYERDRRYGLLVDEASQLGATLLANPDDTLFLDTKYTEAVLDEKRAQLIGPDRWTTTATDNYIEADAERVIRALRVKFLFHEEPIDPMNMYSRFFDEGDYGWNRITKVLKGIIDYLDKPLIGDTEAVEKEKRRRATIQTKLTKEMLVMMEADPYMVLFITLRTPLLRVFPHFRHHPSEYFSGLLRKEAFYFQGPEFNPIPQKGRTPETILASRKLWLAERMAGRGCSGLKLFLNAYDDVTRSPDNIHLTEDEAQFLFSRQNGDQFGLFGFEENRSSATNGHDHTGIFYSNIINRRLHPFLENIGLHLAGYTSGGPPERRSQIINSYTDGLNFVLRRLGEVISSGTKNFSLTSLFDDDITVMPPRFQEEIKLQLYAAGFIRPFGSGQYVDAAQWELEDFRIVEKLWHRDDRDEWTIIRHSCESKFRETIEDLKKNKVKRDRRDRKRTVVMSDRSAADLARRLSQRYVDHYLRRFYSTSALYNFHPLPEFVWREWILQQTDVIAKS